MILELVFPQQLPSCKLQVISQSNTPVLETANGTVAAHGIRFGFEGGRTILGPDKRTYLFTAELWKQPINARMRISAWQEDVKLSLSSSLTPSWERIRTLAQSNQSFPLIAFDQTCSASWCDWKGYDSTQLSLRATYKCDPNDLHASPWAPFPIYDEQDKVWWVLYVGYRCDFTQLVTVGAGNIFAARSLVAGSDGIAGPYAKSILILGPDGTTPETRWGNRSHEAKYYVDQISPYALPNGGYAAMVGSVTTALLTAPKPQGPWTYVEDIPPDVINKTPLSPYNENPVITRVNVPITYFYANGTNISTTELIYVAVFDTVFNEHAGFGVSFSYDGLKWTKGSDVPIPGGCRTPLGLLPLSDENGTFRMFFTRRFPDCEKRIQLDNCGGFGVAYVSQCSPIYKSQIQISCNKI